MSETQNDNDKYPWSDANHPDKPGNSFLAIHRRCRVTLDGEDVADRCVFFDTVYGVVRLLLHKDGKPYYDPAVDGVADEWRRGKVEVFVSGGAR